MVHVRSIAAAALASALAAVMSEVLFRGGSCGACSRATRGTHPIRNLLDAGARRPAHVHLRRLPSVFCAGCVSCAAAAWQVLACGGRWRR